MNTEMMMEEKLVINGLEQGKELANRLLNNLKHNSSVDSNKTLISEIIRIIQNAIFILSLNEDKNILKRNPEIEDKDSKKKRKISENAKIVFTREEEDGYSWRKYGQKVISGYKNPRTYFRCTHKFTQNCLAAKQVHRSDTDPSLFQVNYLGNHTCNNNTTSPSVPLFEEVNRVHITEEIKPMKSKEVMINLEDLEENKKDIFWKNLLEDLTPATSGSGITHEIVSASALIENMETAESYFSSLDDIINLGQECLW